MKRVLRTHERHLHTATTPSPRVAMQPKDVNGMVPSRPAPRPPVSSNGMTRLAPPPIMGKDSGIGMPRQGEDLPAIAYIPPSQPDSSPMLPEEHRSRSNYKQWHITICNSLRGSFSSSSLPATASATARTRNAPSTATTHAGGTKSKQTTTHPAAHPANASKSIPTPTKSQRYPTSKSASQT